MKLFTPPARLAPALSRDLRKGLSRDLRIALFRWRRLLAAVLMVISLAAAGVVAALPAAMRAAGGARPATSSTPGTAAEAPQLGETVLVVRVPAAEAAHLRAGDRVLVVSLKPPPDGDGQQAPDRQQPGRVLWKEDPPGGLGVERPASRRDAALGIAVQAEAASRLALSVRQGEVMVTSLPG